MATIRDMIPAFDLFQPATVEDALELLAEHGRGAWVMAGGLDSFDWFKDRIKRPRAVIDIGGIEELRGIRDAQGGLEIGPMTSLTEGLVTHCWTHVELAPGRLQRAPARGSCTSRPRRAPRA